MLDRRDTEILAEFFTGEMLDMAIKRVEDGEPLAYVIGRWYFYGLTFKLNRDCLIPRPDTEHVVDKAISLIPKNGTFADLCTGSGCIAISVKKHRPDLFGYALDVSMNAIEMTKQNAKENGVTLTYLVTDVLTQEPDEIFPMLDAVISNPPYIRTDVLKGLDVAKTEPLIALDGGSDGLVFYKTIVEKYLPILKKDGVFIFEIGYDQADDLKEIAKKHNLNCEIFKDYGGNDRVAVMKRL
jgi:release factor glutamine methyltransferase